MTAAPLEPLESLDRLLARHGLAGKPGEPFRNDGWSGAEMALMRRGGGDRFVLKRDSLERDWIARATRDGPVLREAWFAHAYAARLPPPVVAPYLGAAVDGDEFSVLMPDLTGVLFDWDAPISGEQLDFVLAGLAELHAYPWQTSGRLIDGPWCPIPERIALINRPALERAGPARDAVADRLLPGWDAWDRLATPAARLLIASLAADPTALIAALEDQPKTLIHGDLKLANAGITDDRSLVLVDWQMVMFGPVAIELGWFLVSNVASLPLTPEETLARYWAIRDDEPRREDDLAFLVGLLLRGWRKGLDAEAGITLASGVAAADDLAWWCERAVAAADRVL